MLSGEAIFVYSRRQPRNSRVRKRATWLASPKDTWPAIGKTGMIAVNKDV
jgi:hypothetical protein